MLHHLAQAAHALPQAAVLGPLIYYHDQPRRVWRCGDREYPWLPFPLRVSARALERAGMPPLRVDYVTGCAMLVRRAVFERVGLLDPRYFMYFEDADFCRRARQHGFQVWCVPRAQMWHKVSQSSRTNKPASRSMQAWGRAFFFRRHPHGAVPGLTTLYLLAKVMWNSVQDIRLGEWHLLRPLWRGTLEGFAGTGPTSLSDFRSATSTSRADTV
jgi:hypothetical protein